MYTYDILNRQTSVTNGGGTTSYVYDARGRRVAKINGGQTSHFIYDSNYRVIEERDNSESVIATYTYGQGMDEPLTMERNSQTYYYHRDGLGSVTEVSDSSGVIVERYKYDIYGAATIYDGNDVEITASAVGNPYLFTGRRFDPESGNYYYRARVYSPELGRFLSVDPLGFDAGDYNLYRYVFNNPINATDPTGEFAWVLPFLLSAATEAAVDALMQATVSYFFDPSVTTVSEAFASVNLGQVGVAFVTGLLPGGRWVKSGAAAIGAVLLNYFDALSNCREYTEGQALFDFATNMAFELLGDYAGELLVRYGADAVKAGFRRLGIGDDVIENTLNKLDDNLDGSGNNNQNNPPNLSCSFSADTTVVTDDGDIVISELEEGILVLAYNEETGEIDYYPIIATWSHEDPVIQYLTIDGERIETTPNHPFKTGSGEWLPAGELQVSDTIHTSQGTTGTVQAITFVYDPQPMYNLTVDTAHTYFVGDGQWLVHNACKIPWLNRFSLTPDENDALNTAIEHIRNGTMPPGFNRNNHWGGPRDIYRNDFNDLPPGVQYRIYDVPSRTGDPSRGNRRIVTGGDGKWYYTNTHYGRDNNGNLTSQKPFFRLK